MLQNEENIALQISQIFLYTHAGILRAKFPYVIAIKVCKTFCEICATFRNQTFQFK